MTVERTRPALRGALVALALMVSGGAPAIAAGPDLGAARAALGRWQLGEAEALLAGDPAAADVVEHAVLLARLDLQRSRYAQVDRRLTPILTAHPQAWEARTVLGRALLATGEHARATATLDALADAYNADTLKGGRDLMWLGVAMHLTGWFKSANRAFGEAVSADPRLVDAKLRWAELFIDKYNFHDSDQLYREVERARPGDLSAAVGRARIDIRSDRELGRARERLDRVLATAPECVPAHNLLALIELESERPEAAAAHLRDHSLAIAPADPEALALLGAAYYLADDARRYRETERRAMQGNPRFAAFYTAVAEHASRVHRYREALALDQRALALDPDHYAALAGLGMGYSRLGDDAQAIRNLERAFDGDPYDVRTYNLLAHFYDDVKRHYEWIDVGPIRLRVHKAERAVLERYVPGLLSEAYAWLTKRYGFEPKAPLHVEIFPDRQTFSVRSTGLPRLSAHGICFGHVVTSRSPSAGNFNWGEVLWHELSHVYHIQLSNSRVPRWFTEGLAVYESAEGRPAWTREMDEDLLAYREARKLRGVGDFNLAFTQAKTLHDILVAYYHAYKVARFVVKQWGFAKMRKMLVAWGESLSTAEVIRTVLGVDEATFDARFFAWLDADLGYLTHGLRLDTAKVSASPDEWLAAADAKRDDAAAQADAALAAMAKGDRDAALELADRALAIDGALPHARLVRARARLDGRLYARAREDYEALLAAGHDGLEIRRGLALTLRGLGEGKAAAAQLKRAIAFHPHHAPLYHALIERLDAEGMTAEAWAWRKKAAAVDQMNSGLIKALLEGAQAQGASAADVLALVEQGNHIAPFDAELHVLAAKALAAAGEDEQARFEAASALVIDPANADAKELAAP